MRLRPGNSDESGAYSVTRARTAQSRVCSFLTAVNRIAQLLEIEEGLVAPVRELHNSNGRRTVEMRSFLARVEMTSKDVFHPQNVRVNLRNAERISGSIIPPITF